MDPSSDYVLDWSTPHMQTFHFSSPRPSQVSPTISQQMLQAQTHFQPPSPQFQSLTVSFDQEQLHVVSQAAEDVVMEDEKTRPETIEATSQNPDRSRIVPRSRYGLLDWDTHKDKICQFYMREDKSLKETQTLMKQQYSFDASEKLYKAKFKEWGWQKNLPSALAMFMSQRADKRKQELSKETIFIYGGKKWTPQRVEDTLSRTKKPRNNQNDPAQTPDGVVIQTPNDNDNMPSPQIVSSIEYTALEEDLESFSQDLQDEVTVCLTWKGLSGSDFLHMWQSAMASATLDVEERERRLKQALQGLRHVSGVSHEDTRKVTFALANFYAETGRSDDAIKVAEDIIADYVKTLGQMHRKTQELVLQIVEYLNTWERHAEAMGLMARAREVLEQEETESMRPKQTTRAKRRGKKSLLAQPGMKDEDVRQVTRSIQQNPSAGEIEHGLVLARSCVASQDHAAESLLFAVIKYCESQPEVLFKQHMIARGELLRLYIKLDLEQQATFEETLLAVEKTWDLYSWDKEKFESFELMEASLQVIANAMKRGYRFETIRLFRKGSELATTVFGCDDERTIWVLISVGLACQTHLGWDDAEEFFDQAYAAALAKTEWSPTDGILRSLEAARDSRHFSYLSDEGRPYKSIFGVSGLTIMPGRLHLE